MLFIMDLGCDVRNRFSVLVCFGGWIKCHVQTFLCFAIILATPGFASFSTQGQTSENQGGGNTVHPGDDTETDTFAPQYPYYNWNQYDTTYKPQSY
jgi:hypothetical protein